MQSAFPAAAEAFRHAADADPASARAHLYLGTAYFQQYIPGAISSENLAFGDAAAREFARVLELDPSNRVAVASLALLYLEPKNYDAAEGWYERLTRIDPKNAEAYCYLGFIGWSKWYPAYEAARKQSGMAPMDIGPMPEGKAKEILRINYFSIVERAPDNLRSALALDSRYSDALAYMNLLIRERANLFARQAEYDREIEAANDWLQKSLAARVPQVDEAPDTGTVRQRTRVAEPVQAQRLTVRAVPIVPADLLANGPVVLGVVVGKEGHILNVKVERGYGLLTRPASDAVKQYVYQPTLLNGQPVEVATTVTIAFP